MKTIIVIILICVSSLTKAQVKAVFAGKDDGNISKKEFLQAKKLLVSVIKRDSSWAIDTTWKVSSFQVTVAGKKTPSKEFKVKGDMIPSEVESLVKEAEAGSTKVVFENVMANLRNMTRGLPTLTLTIVE